MYFVTFGKAGKYTPFLCPNFPFPRMARTDLKKIGPIFFFFFFFQVCSCCAGVDPE